MFRNSIKESGESPLGPVDLSRRDSLMRLYDAIKNAAQDGRVSCHSILNNKCFNFKISFFCGTISSSFYQFRFLNWLYD